MRATAAVRQRTDTENYSLPAQSTLRMAGITAVNSQIGQPTFWLRENKLRGVGV